jgi:hypothetical protein
VCIKIKYHSYVLFLFPHPWVKKKLYLMLIFIPMLSILTKHVHSKNKTFIHILAIQFFIIKQHLKK